MKIKLEVHEFKELLEQKQLPPGWSEVDRRVWMALKDESIASVLHELGDPLEYCHEGHTPSGYPDRLWRCSLPKGHSGTHVAQLCKDDDGNAITWEPKR